MHKYAKVTRFRMKEKKTIGKIKKKQTKWKSRIDNLVKGYKFQNRNKSKTPHDFHSPAEIFHIIDFSLNKNPNFWPQILYIVTDFSGSIRGSGWYWFQNLNLKT